MDKKGLVLVFATALISGVSIFVNKFGVKGIAPGMFAMLKNGLVALLILTVLVGVKEWPRLKALSARSWGKLALIGLIGGSIPFLLFFTGLKMTTAAQAGLVHKSMFVLVALLATTFLKERLSKQLLIGAALLIAGNLVVLKVTSFTVGTGDLLIVIATLFWAVEITLSKYVTRELPGRIVALGRMGFGSAFLLFYLTATGEAGGFITLSGAQWLWVLVTGVFLFGYVFTFYEGLARVPASVAVCILTLGTAITTLLNLVYNQTLAWQPVVGSVLLLAGALTVASSRIALPSPRRALQ